jgi:hypothetical protein
MPVYIELFHGRRRPDEDLDDWGSDGPVLGPFSFVHTTYGNDIKLGSTTDKGESVGSLVVYEDLVYYDGVYYGDWSVFDKNMSNHPDLRKRIQAFDKKKATIPAHRTLKEVHYSAASEPYRQ